jgi:hypothetical protein
MKLLDEGLAHRCGTDENSATIDAADALRDDGSRVMCQP